MEDIQKVNEALLIVEKYSDYLCRKAWGKTLIIWGILLPIGWFLVFKGSYFSELLNMGTGAFIFLITSLIILTGIGLTFYNFTSASRIVKAKNESTKSSIYDNYFHGVSIGLTWAILFFLSGFIPEPFSVVSDVWAGGFATIISYFLLKKFHDRFPEILLVGVLLLITSIPLVLLVLTDVELAQVATVIVFAVSFLAGGFYSLTIAMKIISGNA